MKPGSNRRPRPRPNNNNANNNNKRQGGRNSYDSNGPDGKVRGTAQQVLEKYQALGRDATSAGDRIAAEAYFQYAEHYYRLVNADGGAQQTSRNDQQAEYDGNQDDDSYGNGNNGGNGNGNISQRQPETTAPPVKTAEPEAPAPEVVNVPIMPGPIAAPSADKIPGQGSDQPDLQGQEDADQPAADAVSEEKPKPVRRRRPRVKAEPSDGSPAEPVQA